MAIKIILKKRVDAPAPAPLVPKAVAPVILADRPPMDSAYRAVRAQNSNPPLSWWLMYHYLKSQHAMIMLSDGIYNELSADLIRGWDKLPDMYTGLVTCTDVERGEIATWQEQDYPSSVRAAARVMASTFWGVKLVTMKEEFHVD